MRRLTILLTVAAVVLWAAGDAFAQAEEFVLPPVELKPDRPTTAEPIPPVEDEGEAAEETPAEPEAEEPAEAPEEEPAEAPEEEPTEAPEEPAAEEAEAPAEEPAPEAAAEEPVEEEPEEPGEEAAFEAPAEEPEPEVEAEPAEVATPEVPEAVTAVIKEPEAEPKPEEIQAEAVEAQIEPEPDIDLTGMGELGLAEEVTRTRKAYERAIKALKDYYLEHGKVYKLEWANTELEAFEKVPKVRYLTAPEVAGPDLRPRRRIAAADQLYEEGLHFKNYPAFPPGKEDYLKIALQKFQTIIERYPESDKVDDTAFQMGEIYGGWYFEDWARAVLAYQRCWEWNPDTDHPARLNAAKIYEERLKNRIKAVELYNAVLRKAKDPEQAAKARERIKALTGK